MNVAGIIAEYNPLTRGHQLHMEETRRRGATHLVVILGSSFTQRGEVALVSKACRTRMALAAGADLVLELPLPYAMSTAQNFAFGGVCALQQLGMVNTLSFGSESGDAAALTALADLLETAAFSARLTTHLETGIGFAAARQQAVADLGGSTLAGLLTCPNDTLGLEYLLAARRLKAEFHFLTIPRVGAGHGTDHPIYPSAGAIRAKAAVNPKAAAQLLPAESRTLFLQEWEAGRFAHFSQLETAILCKLKMLSEETFAQLPDISEGLEHRLFTAVQSASDFSGLLDRLKTKRYPTARLRRLLLAAFLELDGRFWNQPLPYLRILGMGDEGPTLLAAAKGKAAVPIVARTGEILALGEEAKALLNAEHRGTAMFGLAQEKPEALEEYRYQVIRSHAPYRL